MLSDSDCPIGFTPHDGDIAGAGLVSKQFDSLDQCANLCNLRNDCRSFIYSATDKMCKVMNGKLPTHGKYKDYQFCSKKSGNLTVLGGLSYNIY